MVLILLLLSSLVSLSLCTYTRTHTHTMHTHTTHPYMHIACCQFGQHASQLLKNSAQVSDYYLLSYAFWTFLCYFKHLQDAFQVSSEFRSFTLCCPSFTFLLSHLPVMDGMAKRMEMMVGAGWKSFLFLIGMIDYFCSILSRNIGILGHCHFSELGPLGAKGRQE